MTVRPHADRAVILAYFILTAAYVAVFWIPRLPPLVDYPQHLAIAATLRRLFEPSSPEHATFVVNAWTYNGAFHFAVAALSYLVSIETAGKVLLSAIPVLTALGAAHLTDVTGRPRWYGLALLPTSWSYAVGWGFINFALSVPLVWIGWCEWQRWRTTRRRVHLVATVALGLLLSVLHMIGTAAFCLSIAASLFADAASLGKSWTSRIRGFRARAWPAFPGGLVLVTLYLHSRYVPYDLWSYPGEGTDEPLWGKLVNLPEYVGGNLADHTDAALVAAAAAVMGAIWWTAPSRTDSRPARMLAIVFSALYLLCPRIWMGTGIVFERLALFACAFAVAATPLAAPRFATMARFALASVIALHAANLVAHAAMFSEQEDADRILDDVPAGRRLIALTYATRGEPVVRRDSWIHLAAFYPARRPGDIAYSFARYGGMPVHYRTPAEHPVPFDFEWDPKDYDPRADWARSFDTALVRTPRSAPDADPRVRAFGADASRVDLMSHRGRFWLYDLSGIARAANEERTWSERP